MSYCVNCGVELEKNCRECPLCDTPVINPREKISKDKSVYPDEIHIPKSLSKKYVVFVLTMILLIPNLVAVARTVALFSTMYKPNTTHRSLADDKYIITTTSHTFYVLQQCMSETLFLYFPGV